MRITRVLETHTHADHVSGHGRLALEHGAPVSVHPAAEPEFAFEPLADGQEIALGEVAIRVLHTPGHRPEHCCFSSSTALAATSLARDHRRLAARSATRRGPTSPSTAIDGAHGLFRSLQRLLELPDGVEVYPGHVAGSLCGAGMSSKASSTIGFERPFNRALASRRTRTSSSQDRATRPRRGRRTWSASSSSTAGRSSAPSRRSARRLGRRRRRARRPRRRRVRRRPCPRRLQRARLGLVVRDEGGLRPRRPTSRSRSTPPRPRRREQAAAGLRSVGLFELARLPRPGRREREARADRDRRARRALAEGDVEVIDVREKSERDEGYIAGSGTSRTASSATSSTTSNASGPWSRSAPAVRAP